MLSEVLRAGHEPTAGLFHLSTPDSILMSYQKSTHGGVDELGAFTQIGAFGLTGEWVFGQRTQCGMMAAPYGSGFPAMAAD
jgi:hypothetical protein